MLSGNLTWNLDPLSLHYNRPIRPLSTTRPAFREGLDIPVTSGCTIGQAVFVRSGPHVQEQIGRSFLWRKYGPFKSLQGWSGSPLTTKNDSGETTVFAFQNWEWAQLRGVGEPSEPEAARKLIEMGKYPFYGAYFLPNKIKSSEILCSKPKQL